MFLKSRILALAATGALAAMMALPAFAQALWADDAFGLTSGDNVEVWAFAESRSYPQTINVTYQSSGPSYSGPSSVVVPANSVATSFNVETGPGVQGDTIWVGMTGPTSGGSCTIWLW